MGVDMENIFHTDSIAIEESHLEDIGLGEEFTNRVQEVLCTALERTEPTSSFVREQIESRETFGLCFLKGVVQSQQTMMLQKMQELGNVSDTVVDRIKEITDEFISVLEGEYYNEA